MKLEVIKRSLCSLVRGMMRRDTMEEKRSNLEKSPLESGEARRRETAQEPPLCPTTVTLNIEATENVT